jgi:hypothetical protein
VEGHREGEGLDELAVLAVDLDAGVLFLDADVDEAVGVDGDLAVAVADLGLAGRRAEEVRDEVVFDFSGLGKGTHGEEGEEAEGGHGGDEEVGVGRGVGGGTTGGKWISAGGTPFSASLFDCISCPRPYPLPYPSIQRI